MVMIPMAFSVVMTPRLENSTRLMRVVIVFVESAIFGDHIVQQLSQSI